LTEECAPVILLGNHRSGTTLLRLLLAETGCFDYLTVYHILAYDTLPSQPAGFADSAAYWALAERFRRLGIHRRAADAVAPSPSAPEEYRFILDGTPFARMSDVGGCAKGQSRSDGRDGRIGGICPR